jgi:WD40 repeat protein
MTHDDFVFGARLSRDETRILSWSGDHTVRLWDVATGKQIGPSMIHNDWVNGALLNRDESRILSWSRDKTVRLWDVATGRQIGPAMLHDKDINGAVLNQDENRILSWSDDGIRLWDASWRGRNLLEIACNHSPPDHDFLDASIRYGIKIADIICQPDKVIPIQ